MGTQRSSLLLLVIQLTFRCTHSQIVDLGGGTSIPTLTTAPDPSTKHPSSLFDLQSFHCHVWAKIPPAMMYFVHIRAHVRDLDSQLQLHVGMA